MSDRSDLKWACQRALLNESAVVADPELEQFVMEGATYEQLLNLTFNPGGEYMDATLIEQALIDHGILQESTDPIADLKRQKAQLVRFERAIEQHKGKDKSTAILVEVIGKDGKSKMVQMKKSVVLDQIASLKKRVGISAARATNDAKTARRTGKSGVVKTDAATVAEQREKEGKIRKAYRWAVDHLKMGKEAAMRWAKTNWNKPGAVGKAKVIGAGAGAVGATAAAIYGAKKIRDRK